ncbi:MAG: membrane protein insertion efficiency factor YidD [Bacteroidota bacterium]
MNFKFPALAGCLLFFCSVFFNGTATAQNFSSDFSLIKQHQFKSHIKEAKKRSFFFVSEKKFMKYNPVSLALGGMMFMYQNIVSSLISADCPYEISCSGFSRNSISTFGLIKGVALSADRLTRCTKSAAKEIHAVDFNAAGKIIDSPQEYRLTK